MPFGLHQKSNEFERWEDNVENKKDTAKRDANENLKSDVEEILSIHNKQMFCIIPFL